MNRSKVRLRTGLGIAVALVVALAWPYPALARPLAPPSTRLAYRCTLAATDLGTSIRVVYRLRSDAPRRRWHLRMWDRKIGFYSGIVRSDHDGRLVVRARTRDFKGPDALRGRARNLATGRVCAVSLTT